MSELQKAFERVAIYRTSKCGALPYQRWMIALADEIHRLQSLPDCDVERTASYLESHEDPKLKHAARLLRITGRQHIDRTAEPQTPGQLNESAITHE